MLAGLAARTEGGDRWAETVESRDTFTQRYHDTGIKISSHKIL